MRGEDSLLGPLPHLPSLVLQPAHSFLPLLHSHGTGVLRKMVLRPRDEIFVLSSIVVLSSRAIWFLTIGIRFFNCSGKAFPLGWQEATELDLA